eukprot:gene2031-2309_t
MAKRSIRPGRLPEPEHEAKVCKVSGSAKYKSKFKSEWEKLYPVRAVKNDSYAFSCVPGNKVVRCDHQGLKDVKDHCTTETHLQEHLGPLLTKLFPDSNIVKSYACRRTKTSAIINVAMGPHCHEYLVEHCKKHPFSLSIDGSGDSDVAKMNPVTLRIFDINRSKTVTSHFYDMSITSGEHAGKAEDIFRVFNAKMVADDMPWAHAKNLNEFEIRLEKSIRGQLVQSIAKFKDKINSLWTKKISEIEKNQKEIEKSQQFQADQFESFRLQVGNVLKENVILRRENESLDARINVQEKKEKDAKYKWKRCKISDLGYSLPPKNGQSDVTGKIYVNESLTSRIKNLLRLTKVKKRELGFKHVWTKNGVINLRKDDNDPIIKINYEADLKILRKTFVQFSVSYAQIL